MLSKIRSCRVQRKNFNYWISLLKNIRVYVALLQVKIKYLRLFSLTYKSETIKSIKRAYTHFRRTYLQSSVPKHLYTNFNF